MFDTPDKKDAILFTGDNFSGERTPLTAPHHAYTTRIFSIQLTVNPLVAAAGPLLALATELRAKPNLEPEQLLKTLTHEIKAFENKAHHLGYRSQIILAARYLLCALIDETILHSDWSKDTEWKKHNLLTTFQRESWGGERFFIILERSAEDPKIFIDVLELGYLCLSLGYQGKYTGKDLHPLARFIDHLYDLIRHERGEFSRRLLVAPQHHEQPPKKNLRLPPVWITLAVTVLTLGLIFIPYYQRLEKATAPMLNTLQKIGQSHHE